jgi:hypothetical protein
MTAARNRKAEFPPGLSTDVGCGSHERLPSLPCSDIKSITAAASTEQLEITPGDGTTARSFSFKCSRHAGAEATFATTLLGLVSWENVV